MALPEPSLVGSWVYVGDDEPPSYVGISKTITIRIPMPMPIKSIEQPGFNGKQTFFPNVMKLDGEQMI